MRGGLQAGLYTGLHKRIALCAWGGVVLGVLQGVAPYADGADTRADKAPKGQRPPSAPAAEPMGWVIMNRQ